MKLTPEMKEIALLVFDEICQPIYDKDAIERHNIVYFAERFLAALPKPEPEPVAYMYQHEDTGIVGFVERYQLDNGFEKLNPRLTLIGPLFAAPQDTAAIEQRVAEACAKRFDQMADEAEVDLAFSVLVEYFRENASTFRSGKWREFL